MELKINKTQQKYASFSGWEETTNFVNKLQLDERVSNIRFKWEFFEYVVRWNQE